MAITAQKLLTELGHRAWSGFNADDMVFGNDDANQALSELNCNIRYLINLKDFPFRGTEQELMAIKNVSSYAMPEGQITDIYFADDFSNLEFVGDNSTYDKTLTGKPTHYWINTSNPDQNIVLYPKPDKNYKLNVVYNQYKPIIGVDGEKKFEFESADDYMNLPSNLEYLFKDCLIMRTMVTNNKDDQDENYAPMRKEFDEMWRVFCKACKPVRTQSWCIW